MSFSERSFGSLESRFSLRSPLSRCGRLPAPLDEDDEVVGIGAGAELVEIVGMGAGATTAAVDELDDS